MNDFIIINSTFSSAKDSHEKAFSDEHLDELFPQCLTKFLITGACRISLECPTKTSLRDKIAKHTFPLKTDDHKVQEFLGKCFPDGLSAQNNFD